MKTLLKTLAFIAGAMLFLFGLLLLAQSPERLYQGAGLMIIGAAICLLVPR